MLLFLIILLERKDARTQKEVMKFAIFRELALAYWNFLTNLTCICSKYHICPCWKCQSIIPRIPMEIQKMTLESMKIVYRLIIWRNYLLFNILSKLWQIITHSSTAPGGWQKSSALFLSVLTIKLLNVCNFKNSQTYGISGFCHPTYL